MVQSSWIDGLEVFNCHLAHGICAFLISQKLTRCCFTSSFGTLNACSRQALAREPSGKSSDATGKVKKRLLGVKTLLEGQCGSLKLLEIAQKRSKPVHFAKRHAFPTGTIACSLALRL